MEKVFQHYSLIPLNPIYKSSIAYIRTLEKRIKVILGKNWKIFTYRYKKSTQFYTSIFLVSPEGIELNSKIELIKYCELRNIERKKIQFIYFHFYDYFPKNSTTTSNNSFMVESIYTPMMRALRAIKAKKKIIKLL